VNSGSRQHETRCFLSLFTPVPQSVHDHSHAGIVGWLHARRAFIAWCVLAEGESTGKNGHAPFREASCLHILILSATRLE